MNMDSIAYHVLGRDIHVLRIVKSNSGLIVCRFSLDVFEGGFTPSCAYLMAIYYEHPGFLYYYVCCVCGGMGSGE